MKTLTASLITLMLFFHNNPKEFDKFWRAYHTKSFDDGTYCTQLWCGIFCEVFGSPPVNQTDVRWERLFLEHQMLEALRLFGEATAP